MPKLDAWRHLDGKIVFDPAHSLTSHATYLVTNLSERQLLYLGFLCLAHSRLFLSFRYYYCAIGFILPIFHRERLSDVQRG